MLTLVPSADATHRLSIHSHLRCERRRAWGPATVRAFQQRRQAFGERVRALRAARGLSQEALADRADLHRTYVGSVERGERNVSLDSIHASRTRSALLLVISSACRE